MLMALDMFAFEIGTLPFQELQHRADWRFGRGDRFGARPATQFLGAGEDKIELTGALYPGDGIGSYSSLGRIRELAARGEAYRLTAGTGDVLGSYIILSLEETQSHFFVDGAPRKADFSLTLERVDG
ncbi:phage tail protein [Altericroceibacterium endophyticum]|uniref:Oxidoreductase n=1 Tax=Altericroceibacterium endophyticum TaxID=1808508 RepID=A0A6I4T925_9SPHN|nr:phage tail protein [Altericroceibacterium endophyticum]MXO66265.1 oxidoreductase [Altericroceibacterium endophyticum]